MRRILLLITFCNLLTINAQVFKGNVKDIALIKESTEKFSSYVMNSNYTMIRASYTEDAKIFPNRTKIIKGLDAIEKYWTLPKKVSITHHKIFQEEINVIDDMAYDYGYYEGITRNKKGEEKLWKGKYVIVWKKIGGDWKMYLDIWNKVD